MTPKKLADLLAHFLEADNEDLEEGEFRGEVVRFSPSIVSTRHFLGVKADNGKQFFITVEEV